MFKKLFNHFNAGKKCEERKLETGRVYFCPFFREEVRVLSFVNSARKAMVQFLDKTILWVSYDELEERTTSARVPLVFQYLDKVEVTVGFYKGHRGRVMKQVIRSSKGRFGWEKASPIYLVRLERGEIEVEVSPHQMEKI